MNIQNQSSYNSKSTKADNRSIKNIRIIFPVQVDKLAIGQILMLLEAEPLSTGEIAERLGLEPSAVSRHMNQSSRQGLVRYDTEHNRYALA